jgi:hypothetical protein
MPEFHEREVETKALDRFLTGSRRLQGRAARERLAPTFRRAEPELAPEELEPYRIMVAWRLVRRTAQAKGLLAGDERMEIAFDIDPDPWSTPTKPLLRPGQSAPSRRSKLALVLALHDEGDGLPLLPPDARTDPDAADRWCSAHAHVARDLGVETTEEGVYGLRGVLDPASASLNFPTPTQILAFEELVVIEATELVVTAGERHTIRHFRERYHFTRDEALQLVKLARARAQEEWSGAVEEDRALLAAYWKDFIERARKEPVGLTHEARGLKELARVLGVTRTEPENSLDSFIKTVGAVAQEARAKALADKPAPKTIEAPKGEDIADAEFTVPKDEEEALRAFDEENAK